MEGWSRMKKPELWRVKHPSFWFLPLSTPTALHALSDKLPLENVFFPPVPSLWFMWGLFFCLHSIFCLQELPPPFTPNLVRTSFCAGPFVPGDVPGSVFPVKVPYTPGNSDWLRDGLMTQTSPREPQRRKGSALGWGGEPESPVKLCKRKPVLAGSQHRRGSSQIQSWRYCMKPWI